MNPPGPEGSKGKQALAGARGVLTSSSSGGAVCSGGRPAGSTAPRSPPAVVLHEGRALLPEGWVYSTRARGSFSTDNSWPGHPKPREVGQGHAAAASTSARRPVARSRTKPRTASVRGMKGEAVMRAIDWRTLSARSVKAPGAQVGRAPV